MFTVIPDARDPDRTPVVLGVIPEERGTDRTPVVPAWYNARVVGTCEQHPNVACRSAEHTVPADRFAREIVGILTAPAARSRRLNFSVRRLAPMPLPCRGHLCYTWMAVMTKGYHF